MRSILDVWQGSENTSGFHLKFLRNIPYKIKWVPGFKYDLALHDILDCEKKLILH